MVTDFELIRYVLLITVYWNYSIYIHVFSSTFCDHNQFQMCWDRCPITYSTSYPGFKENPGYEVVTYYSISFPEPAILGKEREALG